jgi:hypothetical protein
VVPSFTVMTGDKDDPRFDEYYRRGGPLRMFCAFFLSDWPSYMGLGFETRDVHFEPAPNEHYTKLFVFRETAGSKATSGPYIWGRNGALFATIIRIRLFLEQRWEAVREKPTRWVLPPDPTLENRFFAWTHAVERPQLLFVANADTEARAPRFTLPRLSGVGSDATLTCEFSTEQRVPAIDRCLRCNGLWYRVSELAAGEARVYRVVDNAGGSAPGV